MKTLIQTFYDSNFVRTNTEDNTDEVDEMTIGRVSDSNPHRNQQLVGYNDIIGIVTEEDNSEEDDKMEIAVIESLIVTDNL